MKQFAIRRMYSYFETTTDDIEKCIFDEKLEELDKEMKDLLEKYGLKLIAHDTRFIPLQKLSVLKCTKCDNLMINRDKNPAGFGSSELWSDFNSEINRVIQDGGIHEGKELCTECLPISHRWGYFS